MPGKLGIRPVHSSFSVPEEMPLQSISTRTSAGGHRGQRERAQREPLRRLQYDRHRVHTPIPSLRGVRMVPARSCNMYLDDY